MSSSAFLYGIYPVLAALRAKRRSLMRLHVQDSLRISNKKDKSACKKLEKMAEKNCVEVAYSGKGIMNTMAGQRPHQGYILECGALPVESINFLPPAESCQGADNDDTAKCWVALDQVQDPQNVGAILRTAFFLGAEGVIWNKTCTDLSATVSKASAGAMENMNIVEAPRLISFLQQSKEKGWNIMGTSLGPNAVSVSQASILERPTILVLGNEGHGLRANVLKLCDELVAIKGKRNISGAISPESDGVDSLNVSVATGIVLHRLLA